MSQAVRGAKPGTYFNMSGGSVVAGLGYTGSNIVFANNVTGQYGYITSGGLDVSDARRLKVLEDENRKLKKLLAEAMLDNAMLKDLNSKKW